SLALQLFQAFDGHISGKVLWVQDIFGAIDDHHSFQFSPLHCVSVFGIIELLVALIEMECYDINEGDYFELTPLARAAEYGHDEIVKMLVELDVIDINKPSFCGETPLSRAAMK